MKTPNFSVMGSKMVIMSFSRSCSQNRNELMTKLIEKPNGP